MPIEGYASLSSVVQGGTIDLHVSNRPASPGDTVTLTVARLGADAPEDVSITFPAGNHPTPPDASSKGCGWPSAYTLFVPRTWPSGVYTATLTNADGDKAAVVFIVRARAPGESARVLLVYPSNTFQAYNEWGGKSLYGNGEQRARKVSFDRPEGMGPGRTGSLVRWMARKGIAVDVCTSLDLHADALMLGDYRLVISSGHDEYWTREMRDHLEAFVIEGGNVAFFSGNVCYWQARFEDAGRTLVCYRDAVEDPLAGVDNSRVTVQWASAPLNRPQNTLVGVGYESGAGSWNEPGKWKADRYRVNFPEHWVFEGTGLGFGDAFAEGALGYETDAAHMVFEHGIARTTGRDGTPPSFVVLAWADLRHWANEGQAGWATLGIYRSTGTVFTAGSTDWADPIETSPAIDRITRNVIERLSLPQPSHDWESAGTASGVVTMSTALGGLVAVRADGALIWREASGQNLHWREIDRAVSGVRALVDVETGILAATDDGELWRRSVALAPVGWQKVGTAPGVVAMAFTEGQVFAATHDGRLLARPAEGGDVPWNEIGRADGVVAMTSITRMPRMLYAITAAGVLSWRQPVLKDAAWTLIGRAEGATAIAGKDGRLFAATQGGALLVRDAY